MPANWYSPVVEMTLSKATDTVVWELNELLAADRRAKAFSEASAAGDLSARPMGFEEAHWQQISSETDADEEESDLESAEESALEETDVAATAETEAEEEEAIDIDQLLEAKFQEGCKRVSGSPIWRVSSGKRWPSASLRRFRLRWTRFQDLACGDRSVARHRQNRLFAVAQHQ